jgi:RNA polymerase sigma-70 factor (ECF subfamily)
MDPLTQLLLDARDGSDWALDAFIRTTQADVWSLCRHLGDPDSAEDLVQQVYERALRSLPRFRQSGSARGWLLTIARNTCADATRSRRRRRMRHDDRDLPEVEAVDHDLTAVDDLLARLDQERREAFVLTQMVGCSYADAAAIIGCPVGTVRSRVSRARSDLLGFISHAGSSRLQADRRHLS